MDSKAISLLSPVSQFITDKQFTFSYLEKLEKIINDKNLKPEEMQYILESSWLKLINSKLDDSNFLTTRYSNKLSNVIKPQRGVAMKH